MTKETEELFQIGIRKGKLEALKELREFLSDKEFIHKTSIIENFIIPKLEKL